MTYTAHRNSFTTSKATAPPAPTAGTPLAAHQHEFQSLPQRLDMDHQRYIAAAALRTAHDSNVALHDAEVTKWFTGFHRATEQRIATKQLLIMAANDDLAYARESLPEFLTQCAANNNNNTQSKEEAAGVMSAQDALRLMKSVWKALLTEFDYYCYLVEAATRAGIDRYATTDDLMTAAPAYKLGAVEIISSLGIWFHGLRNGISVAARPPLATPILLAVTQAAQADGTTQELRCMFHYFAYSTYIMNARNMGSAQVLSSLLQPSPITMRHEAFPVETVDDSEAFDAMEEDFEDFMSHAGVVLATAAPSYSSGKQHAQQGEVAEGIPTSPHGTPTVLVAC